MRVEAVREAIRELDAKRREVGISDTPQAGFLQALYLVATLAMEHIEAEHERATLSGDERAQGEIAWRLTLLARVMREARAV